MKSNESNPSDRLLYPIHAANAGFMITIIWLSVNSQGVPVAYILNHYFLFFFLLAIIFNFIRWKIIGNQKIEFSTDSYRFLAKSMEESTRLFLGKTPYLPSPIPNYDLYLKHAEAIIAEKRTFKGRKQKELFVEGLRMKKIPQIHALLIPIWLLGLYFGSGPQALSAIDKFWPALSAMMIIGAGMAIYSILIVTYYLTER